MLSNIKYSVDLAQGAALFKLSTLVHCQYHHHSGKAADLTKATLQTISAVVRNIVFH